MGCVVCMWRRSRAAASGMSLHQTFVHVRGTVMVRAVTGSTHATLEACQQVKLAREFITYLLLQDAGSHHTQFLKATLCDQRPWNAKKPGHNAYLGSSSIPEPLQIERSDAMGCAIACMEETCIGYHRKSSSYPCSASSRNHWFISAMAGG